MRPAHLIGPGRRQPATRAALCLGVITWFAPLAAQATYSVAAVDRTTRQVGGAITSCVGATDVGLVYGGAPGHGVVHAQAQLGGPGKAEAVRLLTSGTAPADIIARITAVAFDHDAALRQYGVVDLMGRRAGFTGASARAYKEDRQGESGAFVYSVQGNILTSARVLDQTAAAFTTGGCDLADRLMRALEAGAGGGEGDSRCTQRKRIPSDSAFIEVDLDGEAAGGYLKISVTNTGNTSALPALRSRFDEWRRTHPCPAAETPPQPADAGPAALDSSVPRDSSAGPPSSGPAVGAPRSQADGGGCHLGGANGGAGWLVVVTVILVSATRAMNLHTETERPLKLSGVATSSRRCRRRTSNRLCRVCGPEGPSHR